MLTEGRGLLPQHFGSYIAAGFVNAQGMPRSALLETAAQRQSRRGVVHCTGQAEEVTGHIVMTVIVDTWRLLWRFGPMDRRLTFDFGKNQGLGSVDSSAHDPSTVSLCALASPSHKAISFSLATDVFLASCVAACRAECGQT